ncbi:MAG TPA: FtsX-like permease family protein [Pseudobacteroides sp.]|uniref:ABC transporter permease n=1 Tax=Pseudobacteroides sp. TaxID=1968840 RepID=UPI002F936DA8
MNKLNKMLIREILKNKWQFISAALVIFAGITIFTATIISYRNLKNSMDYSYEKYRFLDFQAKTVGANITSDLIEKIMKLDGVEKVMGRLTADASGNLKGKQKLSVRVLSVPDQGMPPINSISVMSGNYPVSNNECLLSNRFGKYHDIKNGDTISISINNKDLSLKVAGLALGPEFFKLMKSPSSLSDSDGDFGLVFIRESKLSSMLNSKGNYNEVHIIFSKDANKEEVIKKTEELLMPIGLMSSTERSRQLSHIMVSDDIDQIKTLAAVIPVLFLLVAAAIIYIMQKRIIANQRVIIGSLKALGYGDIRILFHYIKFSVLLSLMGSIPAILAGTILSKIMTYEMYLKMYEFPKVITSSSLDLFAVSILLSLLFCVVGSLNAAKKILKIEPAQAMRSEAPKAGRRILVERLTFLWKRLDFGWKVTLRNVFRSRQRSLLTVMGFVFSIMLFVVVFSVTDTVDNVLDFHFNTQQAQDYTADFKQPLPFQNAVNLSKRSGDSKAEPILELPIEISKEAQKRDTKLIAVQKDMKLNKLIDDNGNNMAIPDDGILVANGIAKKLSIKKGDFIKVKLYYKEAKVVTLKVEGIIKQAIGFNCYMNIDAVTRYLSAPKYATGLLVKTLDSNKEPLEKSLLNIPEVESVESRQKALTTVKSLIKLIYIFVGFMAVFCVIMGFSIIFITTVINLTERTRELASLKVLGYSDREIGRTIFRENIILGIIALIPGILFGITLSNLIIPELNSRLMYLESVISVRTYTVTILSVLLYISLAQLTIRKSIKNLDMVEVLKNREA